MAIAGFICSFLIPILGLIFSCVGIKQINERGDNGKGLATAGIVISIISMVVNLILILSGACTLRYYY